jgi:hypothetical protein|tara:strand:- start:1364 stop:1948 length:585 start_codon:yes stop_codon:yes gene_type:complete
MSALSKLVGKPQPWHWFSAKYPVKVKQLNSTSLFKEQTKKHILEAGDALQGRTAAKCLMTKWNMHEDYETFRVVGEAAIEVANLCPVAKRTKPDGSPDDVPLYIKESWGLMYGKGHTCEEHNHWPSLWSYTYCVEACKKCAPLMFNDSANEGTPFHLFPETGQLIVFPAWLNHSVPKQECEHTRTMIAGNLNVK